MGCATTQLCDKCNLEFTSNNFNRHYKCCVGPKLARIKVGHRGGWNKGLTKETHHGVLKQAQTHAQNILAGRCVPRGTPRTEAQKLHLSRCATARGLGGHTSKRKIWYMQVDGTEVFLQSSYEVRMATLLDEMNIAWSRPDPVLWTGSDNRQHRYYPDFRVGDVYFDTKNDYLIQKDAEKIRLVIEQTGIQLYVLPLSSITKEIIALLV